MQTSPGGLIKANIIPRAMALSLLMKIFDLTALGAMMLYKVRAISYPDYGITVDEFAKLMKQKG